VRRSQLLGTCERPTHGDLHIAVRKKRGSDVSRNRKVPTGVCAQLSNVIKFAHVPPDMSNPWGRKFLRMTKCSVSTASSFECLEGRMGRSFPSPQPYCSRPWPECHPLLDPTQLLNASPQHRPKHPRVSSHSIYNASKEIAHASFCGEARTSDMIPWHSVNGSPSSNRLG